MPTPEERIAAGLHQALDHHERARISKFTVERGMAVGGPTAPGIVLTVDDVAPIAVAALLRPSGSVGVRGQPTRAPARSRGVSRARRRW
jgi:hypothetical protein